MKIKTLPLVLSLIVAAPLAYAAPQPVVKWLDGQDAEKPSQKPTPTTDKPKALIADKLQTPIVEDQQEIVEKPSGLQLPVDEKALVGKSVADIVAFAKANPDAAVDIAFAAATVAESPEQATIIVRAIAAALPNQSTEILSTLERAIRLFSEFQAAINSQKPHSESVVNAAQDMANNIQKSVEQGKITQAQANKLIALMVLRSGGGVTKPVSLN